MLRDVSFRVFVPQSGGYTETQMSHTQCVDVPDVCPQCNYTITPLVLPSVAIERGNNSYEFVAILYCQHCRNPFVAKYSSNSNKPFSVLPKSFAARSFEKELEALSPGFVNAYNQAAFAEANEMTELAGMGYRRALEFLVKDYLVHRAPDDADTIKSQALGSCISDRVDAPRLKEAARGATWLGNDFVHYERRYIEYDITHLKRFIDATIHWVLMELTTDEAANMDRR